MCVLSAGGTWELSCNMLVIWLNSAVKIATYLYAKSLQSCLFSTPWTVALQAPLSLGFSRQGYWSGLPCPPAGDLPNPGIEHVSPTSAALALGSLSLVLPGMP